MSLGSCLSLFFVTIILVNNVGAFYGIPDRVGGVAPKVRVAMSQGSLWDLRAVYSCNRAVMHMT